MVSNIDTVDFTLDRSSPPITLELAPESDTGILGDSITAERTVTLIGQTEPNLTVVLVETQQQIIADGDGNFTFTDVPLAIAGAAPFTVVTVDEAGNQGRITQNITREGLNGAPVITSSPLESIDSSQTDIYTYQVEATDPDEDELSYTLLNAPLGAEIDTNGLLTFKLPDNPLTTYDFTVEVSDGRGGTDKQTFTLDVTNVVGGTGTIRGSKWNDLNGDGVRNIDEPRLSGVTVYLDNNNNGVLNAGEPVRVTLEDDPNTSDVNETGEYSFTNLVADTYILREVVPDGFEQTFPNNGSYTVNLTEGETLSDINFGNQETTSGENTAPEFISEPQTEFTVALPGDSFGEIDPEFLNLNLDAGEQETRTVSVTLPTGEDTPTNAADIIFVVDESGSMAEEQDWLTNAILTLDQQLQTQGITSTEYALVGYAGLAEATEDQAQVFNLTANAEIAVYGSGHNLIQQFSLERFAEGQKELEFSLPSNGDYSIVFQGQLDGSLLDYSYEIETQPDPSFFETSADFPLAINGTLETTETEETFTFNARAGQQLFLDGLLSENLLFEANLIDPNGNSLLDERPSRDSEPTLLTTSGEYTLVVENQNEGSGAYALNILDADDATPIDIDQNVVDTIEPNALNLYRISGTAAQELFFDVRSNDFIRWRLFSEDNQELFNPVSLNADTKIVLPQDGDYILSVASISDETTDLEFVVREAETTFDSIVFGETINDTFTASAQRKVYTVDVEAGQLLWFDGLTEDSKDFNVEVLEANGQSFNLLPFRVNRDNEPFLVTTSGELKIVIEAEDEIGDFSFRLLDFADATPINIGDEISGTLSETIDNTTIYQFAGTKGQQLSFNDLEGTSFLNRNVYTKSGNELDLRFTNTALAQNDIYYLVTTGTSFSDETPFRFTLEATGGGEVAQPLNEIFSGTFDESNSEDSYTFTGTAGQTIYIDGLEGELFFRTEILDPNGNSVESGRTRNDFDPFVLPVTGKYTINVNRGASEGNYRFRLLDLNTETIPLNFNTTISSIIDPVNTSTFYRFTGVQGQKLYMDVKQGSFSGSWEVFGSDGVSIENQFLTEDRDRAFVLPVDGEYFLRIAGTNEEIIAYEFTLNALEEELTPINLNDVFEGEIIQPGQQNGYVFNANAGNLLVFNSIEADSERFDEIFYDLVAPDGSFLTEGGVLHQDTAPVTAPYTGEYRLIVRAGTNKTGSYKLQLATQTGVLPLNGNLSGTFSDFGTAQVLSFTGVEGNKIILTPPRNAFWGDATLVSQVSQRLRIDRGGVEDGYNAIAEALSLPTRRGALRNIILVTDEDNDFTGNLTTEGIQNALSTSGVNFTSITNLVLENNDGGIDGLGANSEGTVYLSDGSGGVTTDNLENYEVTVGQFNGGIFDFEPDETIKEYVEPTWNLNGTAWSIEEISKGGDIVESFTKAVVDRQVEDILTKLGVTVNSNNPAISFSNLTGTLEGLNPGDTATFDVSFTGIKGAASTELLFTQIGNSTLFGSIPVVFNQAYFYPALAQDVDGDILTYQLITAPDSANIDETTGLITWNPDTPGDYQFTVEVSDGRGGVDTQDYTVSVTTIAETNQAPEITSVPPETTLDVGENFSYDVNATDPDGDILSYYLQDSPNGMTIDRETGALSWTPANNQTGEQTATVIVLDGKGGRDTQELTFTVNPGNTNNTPLFLSAPPDQAFLSISYSYQPNVIDADGDSLIYVLLTAPEGMSIDDEGLITWNPDVIGTFSVEIEVSDGKGGVATQSYEIVVAETITDNEDPTVNLGFNGSVLEIGETLNLQIQGFDNIAIADLDLAINGTSLSLTPDIATNGTINTASFVANQAGVFKVIATVTDIAGNTASKTQTIRFIDPSDTEAPNIQIDLTQFDEVNSIIRERFELVGNIEDNIEFYRVELAPTSLIDFNNLAANDPSFITIAEGTEGIDGVLATIDPTLFRNDSYYLRIVAQDFNGNLNAQGVIVSIDTPNKPGEFSQEFVDLSISLIGVPIEITRRYSILDSVIKGEFGFGWSLGLQDADIVESSTNGTDLSKDNFFGGNTFTVGTRVTLNTPDGRRVGFTFQPEISGVSLLGAFYRPVFVPDPGVFDTLEVPDFPLSIRSDGSVVPFFFAFTYNPSEYTLTTRDGTKYTYEQNEGLQTVFDRNGNTLTYTDNGIVSSTGASIDFVRDSEGHITEIIDPEGEAISYEYNVNGDLVGVTDREENETTLKYESERPHYLTEIIDPLGRSGTKVEYGDDGRISRFIDADGNALELEFGDAAEFQTIKDPLGNTTTLFYDERGNVVRQVDPLGGETINTYDEANNLLNLTNAEGNTTSFTYDEDGNILTETDGEGNTTTFTYNEFSQVLTTTNALGEVTTNVYDEDGNLLSTTDAEDSTTTYNYDAKGNLNQQTDANGNVTKYGYNALGLLTRITQTLDGEDLVSILGYDNNGNLTSITTPEGRTTTFAYDDEGRLVSATDPSGNISRIEYDSAGQRITIIDALSRRTRFEYNDRGLLTKTIFADGTEEVNQYDVLDRLIGTTDPNGNKIQFQYNPLNELIKVIDAANNTTTYGRDLVGNLISQTDALGRTTTYTYDSVNRLVTTQLPLGQTFTNTYDAVGNIIRTNDFNGDILNYDYDGLGQLLKISTSNNIVLESFTYTPTGQIAAINDERGSTTFTYDEFDRLTRRTDPDNTFMAYTYDGDNNITSLTTPSGTVGYSYDLVGFLDTVTDRDGSVTDYDYDAVGNLIQTNFPNGVAEVATYDLLNRVEELVTTDSNGNVLASYEYTFDNLGNRLTETDSTGRISSYEYNEINQITKVVVTDASLGDQTTDYEYDDAGNLIKKTDSNGETVYTYDSNDRLITETNNGQVITYNYDDAGNLLDKSINGIIVEVYNWNIQGELANATVTRDGNTTNTQYEYNSDGIRVSETVNGVKTNFLIDNNQQEFAQVIEEYDSNSINVIYTHGLDLISQVRGSDKGYYHTDSLGSTRFLTNNAGNVINTYLYDPYGKIINQTEILANSYKFTGEQFDQNLENYYLRARYYNPASGRFVSRDSFGGLLERPLSLNDYLYGEGNPINAIDPSGEVALTELGLLIRRVSASVGGLLLTRKALQEIFFTILVNISIFGGPSEPPSFGKEPIPIEETEKGAGRNNASRNSPTSPERDRPRPEQRPLPNNNPPPANDPPSLRPRSGRSGKLGRLLELFLRLGGKLF